MFRYIGLFGALLAMLGYLFLQSTPVEIQLKKFVGHEPSLVFRFLSDPTFLTDLHPKVRNVFSDSIKPIGTNIEQRRFTITEDIPHIGLQNLSVVYVTNFNHLTIKTEAVLLHGLVYVNLTYQLTKSWNGTVYGTTIEEQTTMHFPYLLVSFGNRTAVETHMQVLNNLEILLDFFTDGNEDEGTFVDDF